MGPCLTGRTQTKAKVESPMKLLEGIRADNGKVNYSELHHLVERINNRVNMTVNQGTGRIPIMYFNKEKASLSPLPKDQIRKHYQIVTTPVKVNSSSMFSYQSNQYSVPAEYIGKTLNLQVHDNYLHVYYNTTLVTLHEISFQKLNYHNSHYFELMKLTLPGEEMNISKFAKENLNLIGAMYQND